MAEYTAIQLNAAGLAAVLILGASMIDECESADVMASSLELLRLTMPCKTIAINNEPYLNRFFVSQDIKGTQEWLHEYVSADSEPHLHSHPWKAISTVLSGGTLKSTPEKMALKKVAFLA